MFLVGKQPPKVVLSVRVCSGQNKMAFFSDLFLAFLSLIKLLNIAFAKGGAHLPIVHTLRLLYNQELRFKG